MHRLRARMCAAALLVAALPLFGACGTDGDDAAGRPTTAPPTVTATKASTAPQTTAAPATTQPATPGSCRFDIHVGTGESSTAGDRPQITTDTSGLFVSCAGAAPVQLRVDREEPALVVTYQGANSRLVQGRSAIAGPYKVTLVEQSGSGGRQLRLTLATAR